MQERHADYSLSYDDSPQAKERIFQMLLEWFKEQNHFDGDQIHQSDSTFEDAPIILTRLAEEGFQFTQTWND